MGINRVGVFVSQVLVRIQVRYKGRTICSNHDLGEECALLWSGYEGDVHSDIIEENLGTTVTSIKERQDDDDVTWHDKGHHRDACWVS